MESKRFSMIKINYEGRFGNQLIQYSHAAVDSIESGEGIENPLDTRIIQFKNITDNIPVRIQYGYYQSPEVVEKLSQYKLKLFKNIEEKEGIFCHLRMGDIEHRSSCRPTIDYYRRALKQCDQAGGFISSDSPRHSDVFALMEEFGLERFDGSEEETILFGAQFSNKALSLGTFSWWIGFLGSQNNVLCPKRSNYDIWHGDIFCVENWRELDIK
jgi:hypothetical protein